MDSAFAFMGYSMMTSAVMGCAVLAVLVAVCGFCACGKTKRCCAVTTGVFSTPLAVATLFLGIMLLGLVQTYETDLAAQDKIKCQNVDQFMQLKYACDAGI